jgi:hypothetical protein
VTEECDIDGIVKQIKVLDGLKQLRETMGDDFFSNTFPELNHLDLDNLIEQQENDLTDMMNKCGNISSDELPGMEFTDEVSEIEAMEVPIDGGDQI